MLLALHYLFLLFPFFPSLFFHLANTVVLLLFLHFVHLRPILPHEAGILHQRTHLDLGVCETYSHTQARYTPKPFKKVRLDFASIWQSPSIAMKVTLESKTKTSRYSTRALVLTNIPSLDHAHERQRTPKLSI